MLLEVRRAQPTPLSVVATLGSGAAALLIDIIKGVGRGDGRRMYRVSERALDDWLSAHTERPPTR